MSNEKRTNYAMFSAEGNRRVARMVSSLGKTIAKEEIGPGQLRDRLRKRMDKIAEKHPEVWDTAVRECIFYELDPLCNKHGYGEIEF